MVNPSGEFSYFFQSTANATVLKQHTEKPNKHCAVRDIFTIITPFHNALLRGKSDTKDDWQSSTKRVRRQAPRTVSLTGLRRHNIGAARLPNRTPYDVSIVAGATQIPIDVST
jgi:hypothetical protein